MPAKKRRALLIERELGDEFHSLYTECTKEFHSLDADRGKQFHCLGTERGEAFQEAKTVVSEKQTIPPFHMATRNQFSAFTWAVKLVLKRFKIAETVAKPFYLNLLGSRFNVD